MKIKSDICHVSYVRNSLAYDHDFWYTCVNWWYLQLFFSFFQNFCFFVLLVEGGGGMGRRWCKCKKWSKMTKNCPSHFISQESYIMWLSFMGCYGEKGRKMVINDKKFCLFCSMSQELYVIRLSFMVLVHIFKMIISPGFFSCFQNFDFPGCYWGFTKKLSKMTKKIVWDTPYLRNHTWYDCHLWYTCVKW